MDIERLITKFNAWVQFDNCGTLDGYAVKTVDGYVIFINNNLSNEKIQKTVEHELWHIILGHLDEYADLSYEDKELEVFLNMRG